MTDRPESLRPKSGAHAVPVTQTPDRMNDGQYLAHALIEAFRTFISLALKRWPELR